MDSLTHIVLGACVGELLMDKKAGRKAMLWGALAQSIPDIDFISGAWLPLSKELLAHRGLTHSFFFAPLASLFLALIAHHWHKLEHITLKKWFSFFLIEIIIHLILDGMNNYGIGWLEPFSSRRYAFNILYVADPLFTLVPLIMFIYLLLKNTDHPHRMRFARIGLMFPLVYLCFAFFNKLKIENAVRPYVKENMSYFTAPTVLNNLLWTAVIKDSSGFQLGYKSVFGERDFVFTHFDQHAEYLDSVHDHEEVMDLKKFSQGFYTMEKWKDTLVFNDLRFGQVNGWEDKQSKFAFHYFLSHPTNNTLIVQRGRFAGLSGSALNELFLKMFALK